MPPVSSIPNLPARMRHPLIPTSLLVAACAIACGANDNDPDFWTQGHDLGGPGFGVGPPPETGGESGVGGNTGNGGWVTTTGGTVGNGGFVGNTGGTVVGNGGFITSTGGTVGNGGFVGNTGGLPPSTGGSTTSTPCTVTFTVTTGP